MLIRSFKVAVTVVAFVAVITHIANCITSEEDKMTRRIPSIISLSTKGLILPRLGLGKVASCYLLFDEVTVSSEY